MAHRRIVRPRPIEDDELTAAMVGIGMQFGGHGARDPNIEDTLLAAATAGMENDDLRVLSILTTWFGVHARYVIASRFIKIVSACESERVRAYAAALATWHSADHRFAPLAQSNGRGRIDLLREGTDFQLRRRGEDPRFAKGPLRVPAGVLRDRTADVLSPQALAKRHRAYHWRIVIGPTLRADMWAAFEADPTLTAAALARRTYGSYGTAWHVRRDAALVNPGPFQDGG